MNYNNIIFIHKNIQDDELFIKSLDKSGNIILFEKDYPDISSIILYLDNELYQSGLKLDNLAFIYHYPGYEVLPFYPDNYHNIIHKGNEFNNEIKKSKYNYISDNIIFLLEYFKSKFSLKNVDIMTCNLNSKHYKEDIKKIQDDINLQIRYSFNNIGNSIDWILESHNINVKNIYFNDEIEQWDGILSQAITNYSDLKFKSTGKHIFDVKNIDIIIDGETITKKYIKVKDGIKIIKWLDISGIGVSDYFFIGKDEIFDGNNAEIDISGFQLMEGLFAFDFIGLWSFTSDEKYYPELKNLGIINGNLLYGGYFARINQLFLIINNCYNTNNVPVLSGGIVGMPNFNSFTLNHIVKNCYNTGNIEQFSGGITSPYSGIRGKCRIENCYNTGNIEQNSGGISGTNSGYYGVCTIENCHNSGNIGQNSGGISGQYTGRSGNCIIKNCYNSGLIGLNGGGITGLYTGIGEQNTSGICNIYNCYNSGNISVNAGGIVGFGLCNNIGENSNGSCNIINCYNTGDIGENSGGIVGPNSNMNFNNNSFGNINVINCYNAGSSTLETSSGILAISSKEVNIKNCYTNNKRTYNGTNNIDNGEDINGLNIHTLDIIENIESQTELNNLFDTLYDIDFIIDNFSNNTIRYPLINSIFTNYFKYDYYNNDISLNSILIKKWNSNSIENYSDIISFFDFNIEFNKNISLFLNNLDNKLINIEIGDINEYIVVNPDNFKYYKRFPNSRLSISQEYNVPDDGIIYFQSGIILYNNEILTNEDNNPPQENIRCICKPKSIPLQFNSHNNIKQVSNKIRLASKLKYNRNLR